MQNENNIIENYAQELSQHARSYTYSDLIMHAKDELLPVLKIAKVMTEELCNHNGTYFYIHTLISQSGDLFEYGVICWKGVEYNILPFNITANSKFITIKELSQYINGGYYNEVETYNDLKEKIGQEIICDYKLSSLDL